MYEGLLITALIISGVGVYMLAGFVKNDVFAKKLYKASHEIIKISRCDSAVQTKIFALFFIIFCFV